MGGKTIDLRITVTALAFGVLLAALTWRCFDLQIVQHERLTRLALRQQERTLDVQPPRGRIYDRLGRPLALNRDSASFFAVPAEVRDPARTARRLAPHLGLSARSLEQRLRQRKDFVWLRRKTPEAAAKAILDLRLPGIHRLSEPQRYYPEGRLACHVLGFVGVDNQGLDGVELQFDRALRGSAGWQRVSRDARGEIVRSASRRSRPAETGADLTLTLDKVVQHVAERELAKVVTRTRARAGSVLVLDPTNGEVLALANAPDFDPNAYGRFSAEARRNRAVRDCYEPGSTFKLVTAAAGLTEGMVQENTLIDCEQGRAKFGSRTVRDHIPYGRLPFREVLSLSSNIGTVKDGQRLGPERLARMARALVYGRTTGLELPGESGGLLKPPDRWTPATLASVPFGQEVAVTTLQTALAYSAVANGGWQPRLTLVRSMSSPEWAARDRDQGDARRQVLAPKIAARLKALLTEVVVHGTGTEARMESYTVAGKTGTAQKPLPGGRGYDPDDHIATFVGFLPAERPRVLVAVVIDSPHGSAWGGVVAGPVFKEICQSLVTYLGVPPETAVAAGSPDLGPGPDPVPRDPVRASALVRVPDLGGLSPAACRAALERAGLRHVFRGQGERALAQRPEPGARVLTGLPVAVRFGEAGPEEPAERVPVPDVSGQSLRNALQVLDAYGLRARITGSGVVVAQSLRPESPARPGEVCALECRDPEGRP